MTARTAVGTAVGALFTGLAGRVTRESVFLEELAEIAAILAGNFRGPRNVAVDFAHHARQIVGTKLRISSLFSTAACACPILGWPRRGRARMSGYVRYSTLTMPLSERRAARIIAFFSSRTLPGHEYVRSMSSARLLTTVRSVLRVHLRKEMLREKLEVLAALAQRRGASGNTSSR